MKITAFVVGGLLILIGLVWVLQGLNIMPGTMMSGKVMWAQIGGVLLVLGIALEILGARMKKK